MHGNLLQGFLEVTEQAAVASAKTIGQGDRHHSDHVAVEAMRSKLDQVPIDGRIVIGEGERDNAPMLYIGERVGQVVQGKSDDLPAVDIAVDPLEGTNLCATGNQNAITVLAAAERGGLLHAPDIYMDKLVVGSHSKDVVDLDAPVADNLQAIAKCLTLTVEELLVVVLDRPRHEVLIRDIYSAGARVRLIGDGDLSAAISASLVGSGVHVVMGSGGAPEGVLAAAALRCLNGEIFGRLIIDTPEKEKRAHSMGITDFKKVYSSVDLAAGKQIFFVATGVTDGTFMKGVRFLNDGYRTSSLVMQTAPHRIQFIETIHVRDNASLETGFHF